MWNAVVETAKNAGNFSSGRNPSTIKTGYKNKNYYRIFDEADVKLLKNKDTFGTSIRCAYTYKGGAITSPLRSIPISSTESLQCTTASLRMTFAMVNLLNHKNDKKFPF